MRWKNKTSYISYFLSNTSAKNYHNWIMYVKINKSKLGRLFLRHGVYSYVVYFAQYAANPDRKDLKDKKVKKIR